MYRFEVSRGLSIPLFMGCVVIRFQELSKYGTLGRPKSESREVTHEAFGSMYSTVDNVKRPTTVDKVASNSTSDLRIWFQWPALIISLLHENHSTIVIVLGVAGHEILPVCPVPKLPGGFTQPLRVLHAVRDCMQGSLPSVL